MPNQDPVRVGVVGIGSCVPETVATNQDLERVLKGETSHEWIVEHVGTRERRISSDKESLPVLMAIAGKRALESAGLTAHDVDIIYAATNATDPFLVPHLAAREQHVLGARNISCVDIHAGCTGGIYEIEQAVSYVRDKKREEGEDITALLVFGDTLTNIIDVEERDYVVILADGAAGMVVKVINEEDKGFRKIITRTDGARGGAIHYESGFRSPFVAANPLTLQNNATLPGRFSMYGRAVNRFILEDDKIEIIAEVLQKSGFGIDALPQATIIPHQANCRTLRGKWAGKFKEMYGYEPKRVYTHSAEIHANTSTASTIIGTDELYRAGELKPGDLTVSEAFGGGLTWGAAVNIWHMPQIKTPQTYDLVEQRALVEEFNGKYQELLKTFYKKKG